MGLCCGTTNEQGKRKQLGKLALHRGRLWSMWEHMSIRTRAIFMHYEAMTVRYSGAKRLIKECLSTLTSPVGVIYIASFINNGSTNDGSGAVYALHGSDGSLLWYHSMYWVVYDSPVLVGSTIYVSTAGGEVFAFQASNGSLLWHFHTNVQ